MSICICIKNQSNSIGSKLVFYMLYDAKIDTFKKIIIIPNASLDLLNTRNRLENDHLLAM